MKLIFDDYESRWIRFIQNQKIVLKTLCSKDGSFVGDVMKLLNVVRGLTNSNSQLSFDWLH